MDGLGNRDHVDDLEDGFGECTDLCVDELGKRTTDRDVAVPAQPPVGDHQPSCLGLLLGQLTNEQHVPLGQIPEPS
ncbi:hypothetical protein EUA04_08385 [Mycolicibacterium obuense]|uniref:Uncharacterized protein n=1 Tax=Mycolicibacterium obuense TaxID=1807 RepID=A0A4R5X8C4_9MYCO|nr:hypothetical protein [Mycolicibacterium obuense]TDL09955.1 hypothetical protein EUA04_08385 [Mycolicibacterium obuense]